MKTEKVLSRNGQLPCPLIKKIDREFGRLGRSIFFVLSWVSTNYNQFFLYRSRNFRNAALTAASRLRGMGTRAPLRIHSSPAESWDAAARFTT